MVRSKGPAKKQQKRGVDFKKIKRKLGRKLPPPKNATNTEIKSKAIILPEQSVGAEKAGLALSKKGLALKELLQQTSHHNAKVRKDALLGIKDLLQNHPSELRVHRCAIIEKLRERISDDDKLVRETLYQLFKSVIFPNCKEDNQGPFVSLVMGFIPTALTSLAIDVRLMTFKFLDLVVQYYPSTFSLYAEMILQKYKEIIQKNQLNVKDKGKLKVVLSGLVRCLSLLPYDKSEVDPGKKSSFGEEMLHAYGTDAVKKRVGFAHIFNILKDLVAVLLNCFQDFRPLVHATPVLDLSLSECMQYILQSIDYAIKFSTYGSRQRQAEFMQASEAPDLFTLDEALSSMLLKKLLGLFPLDSVHHRSEKDDQRYFVLNIVITEIFLQLTEWIYPPEDLCDKFLEFIETALLGKIGNSKRSPRSDWEKNILSILSSIPKLVSRAKHDWKYRLLQAFTQAFKNCSPESSLKLACISTIEKMIIPTEDTPYMMDASDSEIFEYQIAWIRDLPCLLYQLGDKHPSSSQAILHLLLRLGQHGFLNVSFSTTSGEIYNLEDEIQVALQSFYSTSQEEGEVCYGAFITLNQEAQELSICCLYYFSRLSSLLLKSITYCCLCPRLEPYVLFRAIEVLHSAYIAGHIQIADHFSFFITLISRFNVFPGKACPLMELDAGTTNRGSFRTLTRIVCACLPEMGDNTLVFQILKNTLLEQIIVKPPLDNTCAMLRMLCELDSRRTRLSEQDAVTLSDILVDYLINIVQTIPEEDDTNKSTSSYIQMCRYYLMPCFFMFDRSNIIVNHVFTILGTMIKESVSAFASRQDNKIFDNSLNTIKDVVSVILLMHRDVKVQKIISPFKVDIDLILQRIISLQSIETTYLTVEEKHRIQIACERLKIVSSTLLGSEPAE